MESILYIQGGNITPQQMNLNKLSFSQKGIIVHVLSLSVEVLLVLYLFLTYEENKYQKAAYSWVAGEGVSGTIFHPVGKYIWISIVLLSVISFTLAALFNPKPNSYEKEDFDEQDERDTNLKNIFYRKIHFGEMYLLAISLFLIALYPNAEVTVNLYDVGIFIGFFFVLRRLLLISHALYRLYP